MPHLDFILLIYMGSHDLLHGFHVYLLFSEIWTEIFSKYYRESMGEVNIFCLLLNQPLEHTGALISPQECSRALRRA